MTSPNQWLQVAVIREEECIGCTKCIQACPYDSILGANKLMHTVITDICTGCELCLPPCPVDCIDLVAKPVLTPELQKVFQLGALKHKEIRAHRISQEQQKNIDYFNQETLEVRRAAIKASVERVKNKLSEKKSCL